MAPGKRVSMRLRRIISLSVLGSLLLSGLLIFGLPKDLGEQVAKLPETIESLVPEIESKPVTIFDPPKYSIDDSQSLWVVVNKQRPLQTTRYRPLELSFPNFVNPAVQNPYGLKLRSEAALATEKMARAMKAAKKGTLILNSGFRSFKNQRALYERTKESLGFETAERLSARPGFSEHQTGLAADFSARGQGCVIMVCFGDTKAGIWLRENAHRFGFILRYPAESTEITGFQYEPWHFRYVGVELALEMKSKNIKTLEEFWGLDPAPDYAPAAG